MVGVIELYTSIDFLLEWPSLYSSVWTSPLYIRYAYFGESRWVVLLALLTAGYITTERLKTSPSGYV